MELKQAHQIARNGHAVSKSFYFFVRGLLYPLLRICFNLQIEGKEYIPRSGAAIIVPNHKSFFDAFFIILATRRPVHFMGLAKHFHTPLAYVYLRLGAFPVEKNQSDIEAISTAKTILEQEELLAIFPEGVSVRATEHLGQPRRGAARLAMETGALIVPCAITGTERRRFLGLIPKPRQVRIAFAEPIFLEKTIPTPETATEVTQTQMWPQVENKFQSLRSRPGLIAATLIALGLGTVIAARKRRR